MEEEKDIPLNPGTPDEEIWSPPQEFRGSEESVENVENTLSRLSSNLSATNF
jgi:hypothetical protein